MAELFETTVLNGMKLRNRFVHSATNEGMANDDDGTATERWIRLQEELAEGEVGLIIPGNAYVSEQGKSRPGQIGVHNEATMEGLAETAARVHKQGSAIALQLTHSGCNVHVPMGTGALGPSEVNLTGVPCREMTKDDIALRRCQ